MTRIIIANLLIVTAVIMLGLAYRLKRGQKSTIGRNVNNCLQTIRQPRRRSGPGPIERLFLELSIVFNSALYGLTGA